jgi:endonuclease YncB( thermonuclease family)
MLKRPFSQAQKRSGRVDSRQRKGRFHRIADLVLAVAILALLALATERLDRAALQQIAGRAVVADGDSLTILDERIRIRGIDAPELAQECTRHGNRYACGREARSALVALISGETVICTGRERDRYGRLLARCEADGRDLGRMMVEAGWAVAYGDYEDAEVRARSAAKGLWAGSFQAPSDWRADNRAPEEARHDWLMRLLGLLRQLLWGGGLS